MRILVVDDSAFHRRLLIAILGRAGHTVLTAAHGAEALAILEREPVDGVVSDVNMPVMDGYQLLHVIRSDARWASLPFIFYSSVFIDAPAQDLGRDLGATAYLVAKDVEPADVAAEVERLVRRHVRLEYGETIRRLLDDAEFTRRHHRLLMTHLGTEASAEPSELASSGQALDEAVSRLQAERQALAADHDRIIQSTELRLLQELAGYLGDRINNPLAVILGHAELLERRMPGAATEEAARKIRTAVERINGVVREIVARSESPGAS